MAIVITGATGHLGRLVITHLIVRGVPAGDITAIARDGEKASDLAARGVRVYLADYDQPDTFTDAFHPGDRVLLISAPVPGNRAAQHRAVIDAAEKADVAHLAYTSIFGSPTADFLLAREHQTTERSILDSGLPYTFLRNNWYTEMYLTDLPGIMERGVLLSNAPEGSRVASAPRADYAEAAAVVLTTDGHQGKAYELSGDTAWSYEEFTEELTRQSGHKVVHTSLPASEHKQILVNVGVPESFADLLVDADEAIGRGALAATPGDLSNLIGRPTTPIPSVIATALAS